MLLRDDLSMGGGVGLKQFESKQRKGAKKESKCGILFISPKNLRHHQKKKIMLQLKHQTVSHQFDQIQYKILYFMIF